MGHLKRSRLQMTRRLKSSCIAVVMVGPRPAGLLAADPASGLTVRELGGRHIVETADDKYFEKHFGNES